MSCVEGSLSSAVLILTLFSRSSFLSKSPPSSPCLFYLSFLRLSSEANTPLSGSPNLTALASTTSVPDISLATTGSSMKKIEQEVVKSLDLDLGDF